MHNFEVKKGYILREKLVSTQILDITTIRPPSWFGVRSLAPGCTSDNAGQARSTMGAQEKQKVLFVPLFQNESKCETFHMETRDYQGKRVNPLYRPSN